MFTWGEGHDVENKIHSVAFLFFVSVCWGCLKNNTVQKNLRTALSKWCSPLLVKSPHIIHTHAFTKKFQCQSILIKTKRNCYCKLLMPEPHVNTSLGRIMPPYNLYNTRRAHFSFPFPKITIPVQDKLPVTGFSE